MRRLHHERHRTENLGWLRAAVLGANDGVVSTASLVVGVAAAGAGREALLLAGFAGLAAGAMSMAAGEYVSVSSQADTESADLERERGELAADPAAELAELTHIYERRGLDHALARQVAERLTAHDALKAHARDELGINEVYEAQPVRAAVASAAAFAAGATLPLLAVLVAPRDGLTWIVSAWSLACLALLGFVAARVGGSPAARPIARIVFWGAVAMAATAGVGRLFGVAV